MLPDALARCAGPGGIRPPPAAPAGGRAGAFRPRRRPPHAFLPAGSGNDNVQVRKMLQPLIDLAARYKTAIVGITHLNKSIGQQAQYRTMGSLAFSAAARAVWGLAQDRDDPERRLLLPIKNNL